MVRDDDFADIDEPEVKTSPSTPQLKGIRYPGMDLFDAAPEEQRKKRNQKKDSSVLRQLERNASMVKPTETVTSAAGIVLKHRHMDNLENDEPVEGEETIHLPTPRRQRTSAPRRQRTKQAAKKITKGTRRPRRAIETPTKLPSLPTAEATGSGSRFSPTEDESREFKLAVRHVERRKRRKNFVVYEDSSPAFGGDGASESMHSTYVDAGMNQTHLNYAFPPWQKDQTETYDPFKLIRERFNSYASFGGIFQDKENITSLSTQVSYPEHVNPIFFQGHEHEIGLQTSFFTANRLNPIVGPGTDPFQDSLMPARNPLMASLESFQTPTKEESVDLGGEEPATFAHYYRQPLFAP